MFVTFIAALALQAAPQQTPEPLYFDKSARVLIEEISQDCVRRLGIVTNRTSEGVTCTHDHTSPYAELSSLDYSISEFLKGGMERVHDDLSFILSVYIVSEDNEGAVVTANSHVHSRYVVSNGYRIRPALTKDGFVNAETVLKRLGGY